jgi:hypothetical protein
MAVAKQVSNCQAVIKAKKATQSIVKLLKRKEKYLQQKEKPDKASNLKLLLNQINTKTILEFFHFLK